MHVYFGASYKNELQIQPIAVHLAIIFVVGFSVELER